MQKEKMMDKDFSHVQNIEGLRAEIRRTKTDIDLNENDLAERWQRLPQQALKYTMGAIAGAWLSNTTVSRLLLLAKKSTQLIFSKKNSNKAEIKSDVFNDAKKLGMFAALSTLYSWWKKK